MALLVILAPAQLAAAQQTLGEGIVSAPSIGTGEREEISRFAARHVGNLSGTPPQIRSGRNALLEPLRSANVSVAFRLEYSRVLRARLQELSRDERPIVAYNALRIAGELASPASLDILRDGLASPDKTIRYGALHGYQRTFHALARTSPAITSDQILRELGRIEQTMMNEREPVVLDAFVIAMTSASRVPEGRGGALRAEAVRVMARVVGAKARAGHTEEGMISVYLRTSEAVRNALTEVDARQTELPRGVLRETGGMAGDLIALARWSVCERREVSGGDGREVLAAIVANAEAVYYFSHSQLSPRQAVNTRLGTMLQEDNVQGFCDGVGRLIGENGVLTRSPFDFPADRFVIRR